MSPFSRHVALPLIPLALFAAVAATPVETMGCANRGLAAFVIVLASLLAGFFTVFRALRMRLRGEPGSEWWILSTVLLILPAVWLLRVA